MRQMLVGVRWPWVAIALMLLSGCATEYGKLEQKARDAYVAGQYDESVRYACQALKINKDHSESQQLVVDVFPKAVDRHLKNIEAAQQGGQLFRWDSIVKEYEGLVAVNGHVSSLPNMKGKDGKPIRFDIQDYSGPLNAAKSNAAEAHYQQGTALFGKEGRQNRDSAAAEFVAAERYVKGYKDSRELAAEGYYQEALMLMPNRDPASKREAARLFKASLGHVPGYKDAQELYDRARKEGIKRVAIMPFENRSGINKGLGVAETVLDGVVSTIANDKASMEFLEIVSRSELENVMAEQRLGMSGLADQRTAVKAGGLLGAQEILFGKITQVSLEPGTVTREARRVSGFGVVGYQKGKKKKDGTYEQVPQYGTVYATVHVFSLHERASVRGSYNAIDVQTGKIIDMQQFSSEHDSTRKWARFVNGSKDALNGEIAKLIEAEDASPSEGRLLDMVTKDLVGKVSARVRSYATESSTLAKKQ